MQNKLINSSFFKWLAYKDRIHRGPGSVFNQLMRYWHVVLPPLTLYKFANILLCHLEMTLKRSCLRSKPYILRIEATNICNLRCPGCATGLGINPIPKGFLNINEFERLLDRMGYHLLLARFDGLGEPLLNPNIYKLVSIAKQKGLSTALSSHFGEGTLKHGEAKELVKSGLDYIIISLDGPNQEIYEKYRIGGNFAKVCENVKELVAAKLSLKSNTPLIEIQFIGSDNNRHTINLMQEITRSLGADRLRLKMVHHSSLKELKASDFKGHPCFFLYNTLTVGWDGARKLCVNAWGDTEPLKNAFNPGTDQVGNNEEYLIAARKFLGGDRSLNSMEPILGDSSSQILPYRLPRGPNLCRCLACGTTGLVVDRTQNWMREYICM